MERIRDLLARALTHPRNPELPKLTLPLLAAENDNLPVHEDKQRGVYVKNLSEYYVSNTSEVYEVMRQGGTARVVASTGASPFCCRLSCCAADVVLLTGMNAESSRSHSIFVLTVQARNTETGTQKTGSLFLVDLAGSEKISKTGATGQTLEEAKKINKSLSALGLVINALTDGKVRPSPLVVPRSCRALTGSYGFLLHSRHTSPTVTRSSRASCKSRSEATRARPSSSTARLRSTTRPRRSRPCASACAPSRSRTRPASTLNCRRQSSSRCSSAPSATTPTPARTSACSSRR